MRLRSLKPRRKLVWRNLWVEGGILGGNKMILKRKRRKMRRKLKIEQLSLK